VFEVSLQLELNDRYITGVP